MSQISLGESKWRILRRLFLSTNGKLPFDAARNWTRFDGKHVDELVKLGLVTVTDDEKSMVLAITELGKDSQELGFVEV